MQIDIRSILGTMWYQWFALMLIVGLLAMPGVSQAKITEDAVVYGNGLKTDEDGEGNVYATGTFRVYAEDNQKVLLKKVAYAEAVGVQVGVGDVDGDGHQEIVTLPAAPGADPQWKVYNLNGKLQATGSIPEFDGERLGTYHLAVGNVNNTKRDEIVLCNGEDAGVAIDVFQFKEGELKRIDQYTDTELEGYSDGTLVEIANVNISTTQKEIITSPRRGDARLDVWNVNNSEVTHSVGYTEIEVPEDYPKGAHVAGYKGEVFVFTHGPTQSATLHEWIESKGNLNPTETEISIPNVGDVSFHKNSIYYSRFDKKRLVKKNKQGEVVYRITTYSKAGYVDYLNL